MPHRKTKKVSSSFREETLDLLRGIAVILMILAHTIAFFYKGDSSLILFLQRIGDTVCFITFLLVSGASSYLAYIRCTKTEWNKKKHKAMNRVLRLLSLYYVVALFSSIQDFNFPISTQWIKNIIEILVFIKIPGYTEFLLPFIFYGILCIAFWQEIKRLLEKVNLSLVFGVILYIIGTLAYNVTLPSPLNHYKSIFIGNENWFRFPLFQYSIIFIVGLLIGKYLSRRVSSKIRISNLVKFASISAFILAFFVIFRQFSNFPYSEDFGRWPPTVSFLLLGLTFSLSTLAILKMKLGSISLVILKDLFKYLGQNAFLIYVYHIIILQLENRFWTLKFSGIPDIFALFIIITISSSYLTQKIPGFISKLKETKLSFVKIPKMKSKGRAKKKGGLIELFSEKYFLALLIVLIVSGGLAILSIQNLRKNSIDPIREATSQQEPEVKGIYEGEHIVPSIKGKLDRKWVLKETSAEPDLTELVFTVEVFGQNDLGLYPEYEVLDSPIKGSMEKISDNTYQVKLNTDNIDPGEYKIQATASIHDEEFKTKNFKFFVSYPMYVIWTLDWEGGDTSDEELDNLEEFSGKHYGIPITQLFNPTIYVSDDLEKERIDKLTEWILMREGKGDEIGMHLHMRFEAVEAAGVEPITKPQWTDYLNNGHDVPASEYTYDEMIKIFAWAKNEYLKQGLPVPESYRAGGWFADEDVLKAASDSGFLIDTSGRDYYIWGKNHIKGNWNLEVTTQPYQLSEKDQNLSYLEPLLGIWEFPNNGADSWFYTSENLIDRFNQNYTEKVLTEPKVVTYLSHPHFISEDIKILEPTYSYIDEYSIYQNSGPVIYTTLKTAYNDISKN